MQACPTNRGIDKVSPAPRGMMEACPTPRGTVEVSPGLWHGLGHVAYLRGSAVLFSALIG